jgi:predicted dehydrogenase
MAKQFEYFLTCVAGEGKSACDAEVSMNIQRVIDTAYRSAASGNPLPVDGH